MPALASAPGISAAPRRRGRPRAAGRLNRDLVLETAVALALDHTTAKFTIRAIAARLGVSAMAIYSYVEDKGEIERHLLAHLFRTEMRWVDTAACADGPAVLRAVLQSQYHLTRRYPDILTVFTHHATMPEVLRYQEQLYEGFRRCELPARLHRVWARIFGGFVSGAVGLDIVSRDAAWPQLEAAYRTLDPALYPNLAAARAAQPAPTTSLFEIELDALIAAFLTAIRTDTAEIAGVMP